MKKWVILLAISNVVTLIALSVALTVIVMRSYLGEYEKAEKSENDKMAEQADAQKNNYLKAKQSEKTEKQDADENKNEDTKPVANNKENKTETKKKPKKITLEEYNNTDFPNRWKVEIISFDISNPDDSIASIVNMLNIEKYVSTGSVIEGCKVIRITETTILFETSEGVYYEIGINDYPEWSKGEDSEDEGSKGEPLNIEKFQDKKTGKIIPGGQSKPNDSNITTKSESFVDENGNVIVVPKGVDKEKLLKELNEKKNEIKNQDDVAITNVSSEHHALTPQVAYKIKENFVEYLNQPIIENYYDAEKKKFIGILIVKLPEDSMCAELGFKEDDIITHLNNQEVGTNYNLDNAIEQTDFSKGAEIQILRDGKALKLVYSYSLEKMLEYEQKLREAMKESGIDTEKNKNE